MRVERAAGYLQAAEAARQVVLRLRRQLQAFQCIRYFHAFQSWFWRHSSKCASVRVGRSRFHASSNSARASNVSPVPLVCCPGSQPGQKPQVHAHCDSGNRNAGTNSDVADADVAEVDDPAAVRTLCWSAGKFGHAKKLPDFLTNGTGASARSHTVITWPRSHVKPLIARSTS
jgi:hypothetical protein